MATVLDFPPPPVVPPVSRASQIRGAATALVHSARALYRRGWMEGTSGNVSVRLTDADDASVLITASGRSKGELQPTDTVLVGVDGGVAAEHADPAVRPSTETTIHCALYAAFPECGAVVHAHPPHATVLAALAAERGSDVVSFMDFELIKGLDVADPGKVEVPVFANWPQVPRIALDVAAWARQSSPAAGGASPSALLIGHHGATTWGPTLEVARNRLECLEALCQLTLLRQAHFADR